MASTIVADCSSALAFGIEPVEALDERFRDAIRRVDQAQMDGMIDGLGWSGE